MLCKKVLRFLRKLTRELLMMHWFHPWIYSQQKWQQVVIQIFSDKYHSITTHCNQRQKNSTTFGQGDRSNVKGDAYLTHDFRGHCPKWQAQHSCCWALVQIQKIQFEGVTPFCQLDQSQILHNLLKGCQQGLHIQESVMGISHLNHTSSFSIQWIFNGYKMKY